MARLVHTLVVVAKQLARKVVYHCAKLAEAKRRRGATAIQARIRGTLSRMHGFPMQYRVWYELDKQLPRCDKEPLEWEPLTSTDRIKCLVVWRTKVQRWRDGCATDIQRLYRGYAVRQKFQVRQQACGDLRQRHRHATLASTMLAWKGMAHALSQLKTLRRGARQRQIAQWHFEKTHRRRLLRHWGECVRVQRDRARRALLATQFSNRHIQARATKRYIRLGARYGVRTWAEWVSLVKFRRNQHEHCRVFRLRHMFARWKTLKAILRAKALQRQRLDAFATKCKVTRGLVQWLEATDHARDYHVLHMKSQRLFSSTLKRKAFAEWFELWSATAGKRRIASALLIQATWRGIKGRRRFAKAKALHEYKMAKRIERGVDSPECSIDNIAALLTTQQWVILYAYLPWEPPSLQFRKAFCTVATHFHLKRHTSFGFCDATQMDPVTMCDTVTGQPGESVALEASAAVHFRVLARPGTRK
ncbi:hypothetical protein DYB25_009856 [Aphanomyces astaci]|uniref:Uncharacterized protein n=1 Tax=Aphanomyces astaci TaxID=112090 RepID=A0A397AIW2_APHAT|nr:hypothetical protein DYB25_009856 [Aphanomyces astaci]